MAWDGIHLDAEDVSMKARAAFLGGVVPASLDRGPGPEPSQRGNPKKVGLSSSGSASSPRGSRPTSRRA